MSQPTDAHLPPATPDRGLPPVEPPSARFILQLFVVPAVIVTIIVLVWLLFNWLAQMGSDPTKYVAALRGNSKFRWQAAASLADLLTDASNADLKSDRRLAQDLATLLADELKDSTGGEEQLMLEVFLCRALGEFSVVEAVPPLIEAAGRTRAEDIAVRRAALEGLAVYASNRSARDNPITSEIDAALARAAADSDPQIRSVAAFALGVLGDESSIGQLRKMVIDVYPDVRYNAATGLARQGDSAGLNVILEMLDPQEQATFESEDEEQSRDAKRNLIATNGLQAALVLYAALASDDQKRLREAFERLANNDQPAAIRLKAVDALRQLDERRAGGSDRLN
jgi:HEAT repeat protein